MSAKKWDDCGLQEVTGEGEWPCSHQHNRGEKGLQHKISWNPHFQQPKTVYKAQSALPPETEMVWNGSRHLNKKILLHLWEHSWLLHHILFCWWPQQSYQLSSSSARHDTPYRTFTWNNAEKSQKKKKIKDNSHSGSIQGPTNRLTNFSKPPDLNSQWQHNCTASFLHNTLFIHIYVYIIVYLIVFYTKVVYIVNFIQYIVCPVMELSQEFQCVVFSCANDNERHWSYCHVTPDCH